MMKHLILMVFVFYSCLSCSNNEAKNAGNNQTNWERVKEAVREQDDKKKGKKGDDRKKKKDEDKKAEKKENGKKENGKKDETAGTKKETVDFPYSDHLGIIHTWEMPAMLTEISGIAWYEQNKIAAVQDESGIIFIYNLAEKKIEKEISFGTKGDYEGITVTPKAFYVLRADGTVIEVSKIGNDTKEYDTPLEVKDDTEGICYDAKNQRLLISLKASGDALPGTKNIYAFSLVSHKLSDAPVFTINTNDTIFEMGSGGKRKDLFQPSEIAMHPKTGELYFTGGTNSSLLILNNAAKIRFYTLLNPADFPQPEGIAISPIGDVYISTEGVKSAGKIMKVNLINKQIN
ncbi:MAG TPA: hypothetical protein VJY62_13075 [Bacteroidia bacterium]|nr:hypothetical protein [Bacteroidia bacterium]